MIGGKFMSERNKRQYTHIQALDAEITQMWSEGKTQREIADYYGFKDKYVVKRYLKRQRKKQRCIEAGITPRRRGRPPKGYTSTEADKDQEIKRLKMENELLRDFLRIAGKK